jgi:hypothetical protein
MSTKTPPRPRRKPGEYLTASRLTLEAAAQVMDLEDRLEALRATLRDLTAQLHRGRVRASRWDGTTERRLTPERRRAA